MQKEFNITAKNHKISVTSKSLTIDDAEYLYKKITAIKHSPAKKVYAFKYDGSWKMLDYDDDSEKKIVAIFKQVADLIKKRKAEEPAEETKAEEVQTDEPAEETKPEEVQTDEPAEETKAEEVQTEEPAEETKAEEVQTEEPAEEAGTDEQEAVPSAKDITDTLLDIDGIEPEDTDTSRKGRLKKAIIILIIVLAVFVAAGVAYFFILGPSSDASQSPNTDSTHQYNDIDELIDEMQE